MQPAQLQHLCEVLKIGTCVCVMADQSKEARQRVGAAGEGISPPRQHAISPSARLAEGISEKPLEQTYLPGPWRPCWWWRQGWYAAVPLADREGCIVEPELGQGPD